MFRKSKAKQGAPLQAMLNLSMNYIYNVYLKRGQRSYKGPWFIQTIQGHAVRTNNTYTCCMTPYMVSPSWFLHIVCYLVRSRWIIHYTRCTGLFYVLYCMVLFVQMTWKRWLLILKVTESSVCNSSVGGFVINMTMLEASQQLNHEVSWYLYINHYKLCEECEMP